MTLPCILPRLDAASGIQTHGSLANWRPHIHMIVTDGGFREDGTFVPWPAHDTAALAEAFRRAVLRLFVQRGFFEDDEIQAMLAWPQSEFHVHDEVLDPEDDTAFALHLARYYALNPVALERLQYEPKVNRVTYRSDKADGPTAGAEKLDALEFLARMVTHIPDKHQVMTRYYGWCANRPRDERKQLAAEVSEPAPIPVAEREDLTFREARLRWAELLRRIYEVDPLRCPQCAGEMRIVAFILERSVIDRILEHLRRKREAARGPPETLPARARR